MLSVRTDETRKKLRYAAVSVVFVPIGQILIQVLGLFLHNYTAASLLQAVIVTVPNFVANRHFVWRVTSRENLRGQMLVFCVAVLLGVALATLLTHLVETAMANGTTLVRGEAVLVAQLLGLGIVRSAAFSSWTGGSSNSRVTSPSMTTRSSARSRSNLHYALKARDGSTHPRTYASENRPADFATCATTPHCHRC